VANAWVWAGVPGPLTMTSLVPVRTANALVVNPPPDTDNAYAASPTPCTWVTVSPAWVDWACPAVKADALESVSTRMITVWIGDVEL